MRTNAVQGRDQPGIFTPYPSVGFLYVIRQF